jgi:tetratricopeptide (TPR) repeat protein
LIDWARGSLVAALTSNERQRFLLQEQADDGILSLDALRPIEFPTARLDSGRAEPLKACDALAANPTDRYRQANGIDFEKLDVVRALAACEAAVAAHPEDAPARYQLGRIHERAGRLPQALDSYKTAASHGHATAVRRIGQLIQMKVVDESTGLGPYEPWMDRASTAGDPYGQMNVAFRIARSKGIAGATEALRIAVAAYNGRLANAAMQIALDLDGSAQTETDRETAYLYLQISQRLLRVTPAAQIDSQKRERVAARLRIVPRQLSPGALVRLYRAVNEWRPG